VGYLVGVDVGTTNTKAVLYDPAAGRVLGVASRPTRALHPRPELTEYDPAEVWSSVVECIREVTAGRAADVRAVSATSMAEAGVPIDRAGQYLYPIISWLDNRSAPQSERWREWLGPLDAFRITGQTIQAKFSLNKLMWLRENEPAVVERLHKWLCMEDFVLYKLSGVAATDHSLASRTFALDQRTLDWSPTMLGLAGFSAGVFPTAHPSGTAIGEVTRAAAGETGLPVGAVVATGGHDHLCGSLAAGVVGPGALLDSMGTAESGLLLGDRFDPDPRLLQGGYCHYAHVIPGEYVTLFGLLGGGMLEWLVQRLWAGASRSAEARASCFDEALALAADSPPGASGLLWLPHLGGGISRQPDERPRAALVGLTTRHDRGDLVRALLESLSYWLREKLEALAEHAPIGQVITAIGGGTRSELWMQVKADVTGREVHVPRVPESTALGAALLAGVGAATFASAVEAAASVDRPTRVYVPDPDRSARYERLYARQYRQLYPRLAALLDQVGDVWEESR
jgi:xylulokinase